MQVSRSTTTVDGTSEEVAHLLAVDPRFRDSLFSDVQSAHAAPPPATPIRTTGTIWTEFRTMQTGKMKEFLEVLIENKGKVSGDKLASRLSIAQVQVNGLHGTLNGKARKLTGEVRFISTVKHGNLLTYSIRPEVLSKLLGSEGKRATKRKMESLANAHAS